MPTPLKSYYVSRISLFAALIIIILSTFVTGLAEPMQSTAKAPTDADIFRSRAFLEPLVPIGGKTTPDENIALRKAIDLSANKKDQDDYSAILGFLKQFPQSSWRAALLTNLGWTR